MHIAEQERAPLGAYLRAGQRVGHPSCEGGPATGTHLHIARKYNGAWVAAGGALPFVLDGWTVQAGQKPYEGTLVKNGQTVVAHPYASFETHISRPEFIPTLRPWMLPDQESDEN
jgi:LasA protease